MDSLKSLSISFVEFLNQIRCCVRNLNCAYSKNKYKFKIVVENKSMSHGEKRGDSPQNSSHKQK